MEVIANGFIALATATATASIMMGAVSGTIVWKVKKGLVSGGLSTIGLYLIAAIAFLGFPWVAVIMPFGVPLLIMTFLISFLIGNHLETCGKLSPILATLTALCSALAVGALHLMLFIFSMQASIWVSLGAATYLIIFAIRNRNQYTQGRPTVHK